VVLREEGGYPGNSGGGVCSPQHCQQLTAVTHHFFTVFFYTEEVPDGKLYVGRSD
jgi:hypothetical protein